jgi:hypothetical protein
VNLSYSDLIRRLYDLERLAKPPLPGEQGGCMSSYDRRSRYDPATDSYEHWDANDDGSGYIRSEGEWIVVFERNLKLISRSTRATGGARATSANTPWWPTGISGPAGATRMPACRLPSALSTILIPSKANRTFGEPAEHPVCALICLSTAAAIAASANLRSGRARSCAVAHRYAWRPQLS